ncbi:putative ribonuclease H-like domain-containing protein [Tanacetum coccineum]
MHKKYCLVVTDDYSMFTWVFFLTTKDETSEILKNFIKEIENLVDKKVKIIRSDNGTEFKNKVLDDFCREKGIKREYNVARTPQQNGVAERRNRILIEAARTMLADSKLPTTFWVEAVSTACYVQNKVLVVKPHNKTPYELFRGFKPALSFMRPFRCHVTILNTLDSLGKFDGKSDDGFFVGYSLSSTQEEFNAGTSTHKEEISQDCIMMPIWKDASYFDSPSKDVGNDEPKSATDDQKQVEDGPHNKSDEKDNPEVNIGRFKLNTVDPSVNTASLYDPDSPKDMFKMGASHTLEATHVEFFSNEDEPEVDLGNITNSYTVPPTPTIRIHKDHPITNLIGDVKSSIQTKRMTKPTSEHGFLSAVYEQITHDTPNTCLYACFLSHIEPTSIAKALSDSSWVEAMQEELLQFKLQQSAFLYGTIEEYVYVTQPPGFKDPDHPDKVYKLVKALYGLHQAPRVWYETLPNYLLGNGFKRGKIDQTLFIKKQKGDIFLVQVYVDDIIFGSTNKELCTAFEKLIKDKFQMSSMGELTFFLGLQCKKQNVVTTSTTKAEYVAAASCCGQVLWIQNQLLDYGYNFMNTMIHIDNNNLLTKGFDAGRHVKRSRDTKIPQFSGPPIKVGDEAVHKELGDRMEKVATTTSSLEAEQDSDAQTRFKTTSKQSNDPPLLSVNTLGSVEENMKLIELMAHCTTLFELVRKRIERLSELKNRKGVV